jgi:hypothetical protein
VQVKTGPKITEAEDFRGDEPPDANCQFLLEGEDLQGAEEGEPKRKSQAVKRASRHCKTRKRRDLAKWNGQLENAWCYWKKDPITGSAH